MVYTPVLDIILIFVQSQKTFNKPLLQFLFDLEHFSLMFPCQEQEQEQKQQQEQKSIFTKVLYSPLN